jgi:histidinol-phosphate aminotransferase
MRTDLAVSMSTVSGPAPRPGILDIEAYVGGEAKIAGAAHVARLASNEGALGPSPRAMAAYQATAAELHRYPDGGSHALRTALARHYGLEMERIVCGSGSDELISNLVRAYAGPGDEVLYSRHGFLMYPIAAKSVGATPVTAPERDLTTDVDAMLAAVTPRTRMVFLANPNNPTGTYIPVEEVRRLHAGLRSDVLLVIDAAYAEFVSRNDYEPGIDARTGWPMCSIASAARSTSTPPARPPQWRRSRTGNSPIAAARTTTSGCPGRSARCRRSASK